MVKLFLVKKKRGSWGGEVTVIVNRRSGQRCEKDEVSGVGLDRELKVSLFYRTKVTGKSTRRLWVVY